MINLKLATLTFILGCIISGFIVAHIMSKKIYNCSKSNQKLLTYINNIEGRSKYFYVNKKDVCFECGDSKKGLIDSTSCCYIFLLTDFSDTNNE